LHRPGLVDAEKIGKRLFQKGTPAPSAAARTPQVNCGSLSAAPGRLHRPGLVDAEKIGKRLFQKGTPAPSAAATSLKKGYFV
jgi:hypothetical protein